MSWPPPYRILIFTKIHTPRPLPIVLAQCTFHQPSKTIAMAEVVSDPVQFLFLDREEPRRPHFSSPAAVRTTSPDGFLDLSKKEPVIPPARRVQPRAASPSIASSHSSVTSNRDSIFSRQRSSSTRASSISDPPWRAPPTFVQQFMAAPAYDYGYDLPCEFFFIGCNVRLSPAHLEEWISHSLSHFVDAPLPSTAICTFCDEATFQSQGDAEINWRNRMLHIHEHLEDLTPSTNMRPDYWVIEHLQKHELISQEDHTHAVQGTERPLCDNLYSLNYELPEMLRAREKALQQPHDMGKEKRQMKRELKKEKSTYNSSSSSSRPRNPHYNVKVTV